MARWIASLGLSVALGACSFELTPQTAMGDDVPTSDAPDGDGPGDDAPDALLPVWWNPAWSGRLPLTIQATSALPQGFQIGVPIDLDLGPCAGTREQVRVVRDHTTEITRSIDELGADEWIWFRIAAPIAAGATNTEYWLYCGNLAAAPAPSNPATVFELHEDFDAPLAPATWLSQGGVTVAAGGVTLASGGSIHSTATYGANYAIDFAVAATAGAAGAPYFWGGFQQLFTVTQPWVIWVGRVAGEIHPEFRDTTPIWSGASRTLDTTVHFYGVEHYGALARYRHANVPLDTHPYAALATPMNVRLHNYMSGGAVKFDMVRVRRAVDPLPVITVGPVEAILF